MNVMGRKSLAALLRRCDFLKVWWIYYKGMSADDFANMTLDKLFSGKEIKGAKDVLEAKTGKRAL